MQQSIEITLPDGQKHSFAALSTVADVAKHIGSGLFKAALAGVVDEQLVDLSHQIEKNAKVRIITAKDPEGLDILRHSTAHLLAHAVKLLFPTAQVTIGPVIEHGFYYDFAFGRPFSSDDLAAIEQKMHELAECNYPISRHVKTREEAIAYFKSIGEEYKVKIIQSIPNDEALSIYQQDQFADLCRGPHVPSTGAIKAFKLTKVSGAYWLGDAQNEMLQRIYGTAFADQKSLNAYLTQIEEAEKRDHRKIAKQMDLFHFQEEAPGMVFWHANGWAIYKTIKDYIAQKLRQQHYHEVVTPQIVDIELWKKSGHWGNFSKEMFTINTDDRVFAVKPMNCPCHIQIFKQGLKSYRDLPLRLAEFGCVHRNEMAGAMHGLMRVRQLTQDDAHIFCTEAQVQQEAAQFIKLVLEVYYDFGFNDIEVKLATRPTQRIGSDHFWDEAEGALANALNAAGVQYAVLPGEGAFYGPKIEFHLRDCIGRTWQCGTLQLDYNMPERLEASYIAEDGRKTVPAMLHRAILGSLERFIGILIEHYAGKLPLWLAPMQVVVMNITDQQLDFVDEVVDKLQKQGLRVKSDLRNEKIGFKIREHTLANVPYLLVVGDKEVMAKQVAVRTQSGKNLGVMTVDDFVHLVQAEINSKSSSADAAKHF